MFRGSLGLLLLLVTGLVFVQCSTVRHHEEPRDEGAAASLANGFATRGPASANAFNPAYHTGDFTVLGDWVPNATNSAMVDFYRTVPKRFGMFQLSVPGLGELKVPGTNKPLYIRELHYFLFPSGKFLNDNRFAPDNSLGVGMRPIPVVDGNYETVAQAPIGKTAANAQGRADDVVGSEFVDDFLRRAFQYNKDEDRKNGPIFSLIAYGHPELNQGDFGALAEMLKTENGVTHMGAYIGKGHTRNSPVDYHRYTWEVSRYPANLFAVYYDSGERRGVHDRATNFRLFNQNALTTLQLLNELNGGPRFPDDYKFDWFRAITLKETLDFYEKWLNGDNSFFDRPENETYCAEHMTIVLNVALNVPQNLKGYVEIWGTEKGTKLWNLAQQRWKKDREVDGSPVTPAGDMPVTPNSFTPLWKKVYKAKAERKKPVDEDRLGVALAWKAETIADLIHDFTSEYADFGLVGPVWSAAAIMGFMPEARNRLGLQPLKYLELALPIMKTMFKYSLALELSKLPADQRNAAVPKIKLGYEGGLRTVLAKAIPDAAQMEAFVKGVMPTDDKDVPWAVTSAGEYVKNNPAVDGDLTSRIDWVRSQYRVEIVKELDKARAVKPDLGIVESATSGTKRVQFYSPPAILQRIASGLEDKQQYVKIIPLATVMDAAEVEPQQAELSPGIKGVIFKPYE